MQKQDATPPPPRLPLQLCRAAQYVRMSTEHQQYSTENQADRILEYAATHGLEIVRTYADEGKSGLNIGGRAGLQLLLHDIAAKNTDFEVLIPDEAAHDSEIMSPTITG